MKTKITAWLKPEESAWVRPAVGALGGLLILYGVVLAWRADAATSVLAAGLVLLIVAVVVPDDWTRLVFGLPGGASLELERARIAQQSIEFLPLDAKQQLVPSEAAHACDETKELAEPGDSAQPEAAREADASEQARALARQLLNRIAFASHEDGTRWRRLTLKRRSVPDVDLTPVTCAIRKPDGEFLVGVPRLVGWDTPPLILDQQPATGHWLRYEAIFPDFFVEADASVEADLPPGTYTAVWGTAAPAARGHVLASDQFTWP